MTLFGESAPSVPVAAVGSVVGSDHVAAFRDNQDGCAARRGYGWSVVVVTDGCGSAPRSEIGAKLGAVFLARAAVARLARLTPRAACDAIHGDLVSSLAATARALGGGAARARDVLADAFLFSWLCAAVGPTRAVVLGQGDGAFAVDGEVTQLDPGPANAPSYAAYALTSGDLARPVLHVDRPAVRVASLVVATDGAAGLLGRGRPLGDLVASGRLAKNPSLLVKALRVAQRGGGARDDATAGAIVRGAP